MKPKPTFLIQRLRKPDGKDKNVYDLSPVYNGFPVGMVKDLKDVFILDHMSAAEFEHGEAFPVLQDLYHLSRKRSLISKKSLLAFGETFGVYYICPRKLERYVEDVLMDLDDDEASFKLKRSCGLSESLKLLKEKKVPDIVGWIELDNGFFFTVDKKMFEKMKRFFEF